MAAICAGELLKDRYRLERTLGRGGMAAVWLGHDEVLDRPVAVKVLADTIASDPGFVARFRREATTAAGLSHPNLVGVYDFSEEGERPYLVMQFVPGENLAERSERGDGVDCDKLARELLEALTHIHEVGILHRDVKPANIIIEPEGTAKLIDFGIALPRDATALTSTGLVLGTERYAAPEVMEGRPATERSDLYSLGVVLSKCEGVSSPALGALVESLADKNPLGRPASARRALSQLERRDPLVDNPTQAFEPTAAFPVEREPESDPAISPPRTYGRSGSRRGRWGAVAALLALVAAIGVLVPLALDGRDGKDGSGAPEAEAKNGRGDSSQQAGQAAAPSRERGQGADAAASGGSGAAVSESEPEPEPVQATADPATGAALNEEGFALIQAGEYDAAVPVLEEAVGAYPEGSEDLAYAYALFNLGNALRLSGRPDEAIPVLEKRLEIPNQTSAVEEELTAARAESG